MPLTVAGANAVIAAGTLIIAIGAGFGALLTTFGWNSRADAIQRRSAVELVAAEAMINLEVLSDPVIAEPHDANLTKFVFLPRTQVIALDAAISSGLFLPESDRELFTRMYDLREKLLSFNDRVAFTQDQIGYPHADIVSFRRMLRDGAIRQQTHARLFGLGKLLMSPKYGVSPQREFFHTLDER